MDQPQEKPEPVKITITLPTNAYFMSGIRDFTLSMIKNMTNFSEQWAYRFQSVVDELCNNAIEHGSNTKQEIKVSFINYPGDSVEIVVEDSGTGKTKMKAADLQKIVAERSKPGYPFTEIRGRGLAKIVAAWTDELQFEDLANGGLKVKVKKYLKNPALSVPSPSMSGAPDHIVLTI
ncbi:ATP-binding protein [Candidatus Peregrinibacteria bacterium]|nr:ATP-binding protein [Candidatus Peregrinibacteria bacterium]